MLLFIRREQRTDVAEIGGGQERIDERVGDDIAVGVPREATGMLDQDACEHQGNAVCEGVGVEPDADPDLLIQARLTRPAARRARRS